MLHKAYISAGSNLGNRMEYLRKGVESLNRMAGKVNKVSDVFETEAWGMDHGQAFLNIALELETSLTPDALLHIIHDIEESNGRIRKPTGGYQARTLDLDILFYDQLVIKSDFLIIPHPHIASRRFVLEPLARIAPDLVHPELNTSISVLLQQCLDHGRIEMLGPLKKKR